MLRMSGESPKPLEPRRDVHQKVGARRRRDRGVRLFEVAVCDLKRDPDGRVADASLPCAAKPRAVSGAAQTGSDTFSIPNEVRPHCPPTTICHIRNRIGIETMGLK
mgnify:CR=1 FL=1